MLNVIQDLTVHDIINNIVPVLYARVIYTYYSLIILLCMSFEIELSTVAGDHLQIKKITYYIL